MRDAEKLRQIFERESGLETHHAAVSHLGRGIEFDGFYPDGERFHIKAPGSWRNQKAAAVKLARIEKQKYREIHKAMPVSGNLASSIRERVAKLRSRAAESQANALGSLDALEHAVNHTDQFAKDMANEAAEIHAALGNGPPE